MESIGELSVGAVIPRYENNHISVEVLEVCAGTRCVKFVSTFYLVYCFESIIIINEGCTRHEILGYFF